MGNKLDDILKHDFVDSPVIVNLDYETESLDIGNREGEFAIQLNYSGGNGLVNMTLSLEVSNDDFNFSPVDDSFRVITDDDGTHIWNAVGIGPTYLKVKIEVTAGSIVVDRILYSGRRRH